MPDLALVDEELARICGTDFRSARQTRQEVEGRKLAHYQLYRAWDNQTNPKGGQFAQQHGGGIVLGQFNWSRLNVPLAFIIVETIISRMVLQDPEIMAYGLSPDAANFAQAKVMRIKHDLQRCGWEDIQLRCLKDSAIYGDGYTKTVWDNDLKRPVISHIPWFDFWYSPEAMEHDDAEVQWHVTWHTRASLEELATTKGEKGRLIYRNIDRLIDSGGDRTTADDTYLTRRQYAGAGSPQPASLEQRQIPIVEGWYRDGTIITLGGSAYDTVIRSDANPYVDPDNRPWRPFDTFRGTLDPESPYSISLVEMVEDFQREASAITRQAMDQATRNINRPVKFDYTRVKDADVIGAYSRPGGRLPVNGSPQDAVDEGDNVEISRDWETAINRVIMLAQMTAGISDESSGMPPTTRPGVEDTATASWLRAHERNRRVGYLTFITSRTLKSIACKLDYIDRQHNKHPVTVPLTKHLTVDPSQKGVDLHESGTVATISNDVNDPKMRYELKIDDGSLEVGFAGQKAARTVSLAQALSTNPLLAQQVNWREMAAVLAESAGIDPGRVLMTQTPGIPADPNAPPVPGDPGAAGTGAPAPAGPVAGNGAPPGPVPVGAPIPLGPPANGAPPAVTPEMMQLPMPPDGGSQLVGPTYPGDPSAVGAPAGIPPDLIAALTAMQAGVPSGVGDLGGMGGGAPPIGALPPGGAPPSPTAAGGAGDIIINVNMAGAVTKRLIRDQNGQVVEVQEVPTTPAPSAGPTAPLDPFAAMGAAPPPEGPPGLPPLPPELLAGLGGGLG